MLVLGGPRPPGGSGGGFGGTTEEEPYATSAGPLRWRGVEGSRSGFDLGGLVEMQARSYDPSIGRFLQADSLPVASLTTQGMNRHIYCENDPVNASDPLGLVTAPPEVSAGWGWTYITVGIIGLIGLGIAGAAAISNPASALAGAGSVAVMLGLALKALSTIFEGLSMLPGFGTDQRCLLHAYAMYLNFFSELFLLGSLGIARGIPLLVAAIGAAYNFLPSLYGVFANARDASEHMERLLFGFRREAEFC